MSKRRRPDSKPRRPGNSTDKLRPDQWITQRFGDHPPGEHEPTHQLGEKEISEEDGTELMGTELMDRSIGGAIPKTPPPSQAAPRDDTTQFVSLSRTPAPAPSPKDLGYTEDEAPTARHAVPAAAQYSPTDRGIQVPDIRDSFAEDSPSSFGGYRGRPDQSEDVATEFNTARLTDLLEPVDTNAAATELLPRNEASEPSFDPRNIQISHDRSSDAIPEPPTGAGGGLPIGGIMTLVFGALVLLIILVVTAIFLVTLFL